MLEEKRCWLEKKRKREVIGRERQFERLFNKEIIIDIDNIIDNKRSRYNLADFL